MLAVPASLAVYPLSLNLFHKRNLRNWRNLWGFLLVWWAYKKYNLVKW
jgi:hypothetical protein